MIKLPSAWAKILGAKQTQPNSRSLDIQYLSTDSRTITHPGETLFFAIKTPKRDGHAYIEQAYAQGVRCFVVSDRFWLTRFEDATIFFVQDTLAALQSVGGYVRKQFGGQVIGITGSNGKTVVKEWLYQCLSNTHLTVRSPRSYNSQIGVPLSLWLLNQSADLALIEAGISEQGEMQSLAQMIAPQIGILTHMGTAHDAGFPSFQAKLAEKMLLFANSRMLIAGVDDPTVEPFLRAWQSDQVQRQLICWSKRDQHAQVFLISRLRQISFTSLRLRIRTLMHGQHTLEVKIPFTDDASIENALLTITALIALDVAPQDISYWIGKLEPVGMRLEMKSASNGCTLINDSYSNDIQSLRIAMDAATNMRRNQEVTLVLSDLLQTGQTAEDIYGNIAELIIAKQFTRVIGVGTSIQVLGKFLPATINSTFFPDTETLLHEINSNQLQFKNELILLKGARVFAFERIAHRLQQKNHHAVLEINLAAMTHNLNVYRRALQPFVKMMVMVKAAGYGSGEAETARLLEHHGVDYLGVAFADEGIALRRSGVQTPIMVLNPAPDEFDAMYRHQLEPEIYSLDILRAAIDFTGTVHPLSIHLKLDTGMHRLGFEEGDIPELLTLLSHHRNLKILSIFSHLVASDKPEFDDFTHEQVERFNGMYARIADSLGYRPMRHILNTGGIIRFPDYQFDMVRLGIGLYGAEGGHLSEPLHVVHTLKARISQIRTVTAGQTVGYNRNGKISTDAKIATINIGYADGLLRGAGNGRFSLLVGEQLAPTIGNICMDMCMIDVTHIPEVRVGQEVTVFGEKPRVEDLSRVLNTISYEVLTGISSRVKRIYFME